MRAKNFSTIVSELQTHRQRWLVTGAAGFIGSHLVDALLDLNQEVIGVDNYSTGNRENIAEALERGLEMVEGDIVDAAVCQKAARGVTYILHQAGLGSVPRSIEAPLASHYANVDGTLGMLEAARNENVKAFIFASSSSVYGDAAELPKIEGQEGEPLSPYALSKVIDEFYAALYSRIYKLPTFGLRYFNVFGPRQDPNGPYAAVIPRWIETLIDEKQCTINGDPEISRDFCFIRNVVTANIIAALNLTLKHWGQSANIACGARTTLGELHELLVAELSDLAPDIKLRKKPLIGVQRAGDIAHSLADVSLARESIGYEVLVHIKEGLRETIQWYLE